jgi:hypothetical protein
MNRLGENLKFLQTGNADLLRMVNTIKEQNYNTLPSKAGPLTLTYLQNNQSFYIHSRFNPEAEAEKLIQKSKTDADHIVVLGLGAGYHLEKLMQAKPPNARVLLVEPDLEIVKHSLKTMNWRGILNRPDFFYCFGADLNTLAAVVQSFLDVAAFDQLGVIELAAEVRFHAAFFTAARKTIDNEIKTLLYDFKTRLAEEAVVPRNILKNIGGLLHTRRIKHLENKFAGKPGFIVSAGPSLDKNILHLKKVNNRAAILCVDTALKPLLKKGIQPHFTVTADPSYKNYLHLQGTEKTLKYFLVAETGISSRVYDDFHEHIFSVSLGKPIFRMIEENIGQIGEIEAWGSVISLALNTAIFLGLDPIVFLGQDFAFTDMRNHCRHTSWEDKWIEYTRDLGLMQRKEKQSITGVAKVMETPDIHGNKTLTSERLMLYKNYLAKTLTTFTGKRFINATEGGIMSEIESKSLQQVMKEFVYNNETIDFDALFNLPVIYNVQNKKRLLTFFKAKSSFFKKYKKKLEDKIPQLENAGQLPLYSAARLVNECDNLQRQLYDNVKNGEIVELWSQGPIYKFMRKSAKLKEQQLNETNQADFIELYQGYFSSLVPLVSGIIESFDVAVNMLTDE